MLIALSLFVILLLGVWFYSRFYLSYRTFKRKGIKGPEPKFPFGNFRKTLTGKCNFVEELSEIYKIFKNKERFVGIFMTRKPQILIIDPKLSREILVENFKHFSNNVSSKWVSFQIKIKIKEI